MNLTTERLHIEKVSLADAPFYFELMTSPNYLNYIGDKNIRSIEDTQKYIQENNLKHYKELGFGFFKVSLLSSGKPIGICGFAKRDYLPSPDIGYALLPQYERKGYISEADLAIYQYGKEVLQFKEILGITAKNNIVSQHLLRKIGLKPSGTVIEPKTKEEIILFK